MFARGKRIAARCSRRAMHLQCRHEDPLPPVAERCAAHPVASPALAADDFSACLAGLRGDAAAKGVNGDTYSRYTSALEPDMTVIEALDYQPEFRSPIWDYLAALVDDERVADGRAKLAEGATPSGPSRRATVSTPKPWWRCGVESNYGRNFGKRPLVTSLATLSCFGRRQSYFRGEFFTTLKILQEGHVAPEHLNGSWAGAFGHTQFMPSTFMRVAVDFDGDGRRDLVDSVPDALASTANYLVRSGWRSDEPWGYEVKLPQGFDESLAGRKKRRPLAEWVAMGLSRIGDEPVAPHDGPAALLLPAGAAGPAFLVFRNFDAIYSYNAAESYALAIAHLSDWLKGGGDFATPGRPTIQVSPAPSDANCRPCCSSVATTSARWTG